MSRVKLCLEFSISFGIPYSHKEAPGGSSYEDQKMSISQKCPLIGKYIWLSFLLWCYCTQKFEGKEGSGGRTRKEKELQFLDFCAIPLLVSAGERDLWMDMLCTVGKNGFREFMCFPGSVDRNACLKKKWTLLVWQSYGLSLMNLAVALERAGRIGEPICWDVTQA